MSQCVLSILLNKESCRLFSTDCSSKRVLVVEIRSSLKHYLNIVGSDISPLSPVDLFIGHFTICKKGLMKKQGVIAG